MKIPHAPLIRNLDATDVEETGTKCLGLLVSRWKKGPRVTLSEFGRGPMFPTRLKRKVGGIG